MARSRRIISSLKKLDLPALHQMEIHRNNKNESPSAVVLPTFHPFPQLLITQHTKPEQSKLVDGDAPPQTYG